MTTRTRKTLAFLPYAAVAAITAALFTWGVLGLLLPALNDAQEPAPASRSIQTAPTPAPEGDIVDGVFVGEDGSGYCFQGEELLGAVPSPEDCETVFQAVKDWDPEMDSQGDDPFYYLAKVFPNFEERGWDCYFAGELVLAKTSSACLEHGQAVAKEWYYTSPTFVLFLPNVTRPVGAGFPCYVGADVVGHASNPNGCDAVYGEVLTSTPFRQ